MEVGESAATGLALIIHELATNSMKYGALSTPNGTLDVSSLTDEKQITLTWLEHGGPEVRTPNPAEGYGSKLVRHSVTSLGGSIAHDWQNTGLVVTLKLMRARLIALRRTWPGAG